MNWPFLPALSVTSVSSLLYFVQHLSMASAVLSHSLVQDRDWSLTIPLNTPYMVGDLCSAERNTWSSGFGAKEGPVSLPGGMPRLMVHFLWDLL